MAQDPSQVQLASLPAQQLHSPVPFLSIAFASASCPAASVLFVSHARPRLSAPSRGTVWGPPVGHRGFHRASGLRNAPQCSLLLYPAVSGHWPGAGFCVILEHALDQSTDQLLTRVFLAPWRRTRWDLLSRNEIPVSRPKVEPEQNLFRVSRQTKSSFECVRTSACVGTSAPYWAVPHLRGYRLYPSERPTMVTGILRFLTSIISFWCISTLVLRLVLYMMPQANSKHLVLGNKIVSNGRSPSTCRTSPLHPIGPIARRSSPSFTISFVSPSPSTMRSRSSLVQSSLSLAVHHTVFTDTRLLANAV